MGRDNYGGPKMPKVLVDRYNLDTTSSRNGPSRKDRRKAERQEKKTSAAHARKPVRLNSRQQERVPDSPSPDPERTPRRVQPHHDAKPTKSILKKAAPVKAAPPPLESDEETDIEEENLGNMPKISQRAAKAGLEDDDAAIAALEKRLGMRGKQKGKADDFDFLLGSDSEQEEGTGEKRKRPEDSKWLQDKRLKASKGKVQQVEEESDEEESEEEDDMDDGLDDLAAGLGDDDEDDVDEESEEDEDMGDVENPFSEDEVSDGDFDGFGSDADSAPAPRVKENPYVAPVSKGSAPAGKYVPPSLRKAASSDDEVLKQLQRQIKGQLNRLSEANILSIVQAVEQMYENNARQHMTSTLIDLLMALVCDPSPLNDTFLILHAGFAAAIYKIVGTDFGAQLLERIVEAFDAHREDSTGKQSLNMVAFLAGLYTFQVAGSEIVFDYIRLLLDGITETNTELLLRVIRMSGHQLRQDDPSSLKDIVLLLHRNVAEVDKDKLSVRTKFMIETINDLKNNRMKTGVAASSMVTEHIQRMKKTLGTMNTRTIKATQPLSITLADIKDSEKKGKWWLVGASYHDPAKLANGQSNSKPSSSKKDEADIGDSNSSWQEVARQQGMNTNIRRAIFISIHEAQDFKEAHIRILKMNLNAKQRLEIPWVLVRCAGTAKPYNPYYTFVAKQFCNETQLKKAFQFALWDCLKRMDKDEDEDEEEGENAMDVKKIVRLAKMFGTLVAEGGLSITILKNLEFALLSPKKKTFADVMLTTILTHLRKKDKNSFEMAVKYVFGQVSAIPDMNQGLRIFVQNSLSKAELANGKSETKAVKTGSDIIRQTLIEVADSGPTVSAGDDKDVYMSDDSS